MPKPTMPKTNIQDKRPEDGKETDIVILIMGATGAGKSSFINSLIGKNRMTVGHMLTSCTAHLEPVVVDPGDMYPSLKNNRVIIVDTPGFDNTYVGDVEILKRIATWLTTSYKKHMVLGGVVYLHDISQERFSGTACGNLEMFNSLCGDAAMDKVVLVTTKWGRLSQDDGSRRETELKGVHWKDMLDKGSKVKRFLGDQDSAWNVLSIFLKRASEHYQDPGQEINLQIQEEIAVKCRIIPEGNASKELRFTMQESIEMQKMAVALEEEMAKGGGPDVDVMDAGESSRRMPKTNSQDKILENGKETDIVIPIMGATGAGKSSFINCLIGKDKMTVGHKSTPCTANLEPVVVDPGQMFPSLKNYRVIIVDTPSFDDTFVGDVEILKRIATWLATSYKKHMVLGGVVYLHDISQERFSGTARRNLEMFNRLCGDAALSKVVLGTTKWSRLSQDDGSRREAELKGVYWKEMMDKGSKVKRFLGNQESAWNVLSVFLKQASVHYQDPGQEINLQIQEEIAVERRIISETKAGKELRYMMQEFLEVQKMVVALEEEMARGGGSDVDAKLEETRRNLDKLTSQIQDLKVPLSRRIKRFLGLV